MSGAIVTHELVKQFYRVAALNGLNLDVPEGAIYALVGPNGAGKTTAIRVLMNILSPTRGHAEVLSTDSRKVAGAAFESIGYVSENQDLPDWMRIDQLLAYLRPFYPTWDRNLEGSLLQQYALPLDRKLGKLSRGMRMKAALVSALAFHPKLIVLDEPFGGLDPLVRDELIEALLERASESTIFISSHDLADIENLASHVGYLEAGTLRFSEEMTSLGERFREVELTFETSPPLPRSLPEGWIQMGASAAVVRFIESRFEKDRTRADIGRLFPTAREVNFTPMSLRSVFLAMAKEGRGRAANSMPSASPSGPAKENPKTGGTR
jgi:ABC-2 type transport system ATP-binding protein